MMIQSDDYKPKPTDKVFKLRPYQDKFIFSEKRFPCMIAGWGTGKSFCGITSAMRLSHETPKNLGMILRKEFTDLRDSTVKDFEKYTNIKVNSSRDAELPNGSTIMFRHLEELGGNNLQNINLGWFLIEQGEELENDEKFFTLMGRLRRDGCRHVGMVIANANEKNWIYKLWKTGKLDDAELIEATTYDNQENLPEDFIKSLDTIRKNRPEIYERFVMNSYEVKAESFTVIPMATIRNCVNKIPTMHLPFIKKVTVADVAGETEDGDETVILDFENYTVKEKEIYNNVNEMDTVGRIMAHAKRNGSNTICVDKVGLGSGIYARLCEVYANDSSMRVLGFDSRISAPTVEGEKTYKGYGTWAWFQAAKLIKDCWVSVPDDDLLIEQLGGVNYKYVSSGQIKLWDNKDIKKKLNCSPDRAWAFVIGIDTIGKAEVISGKVDNFSRHAYVPERFRQPLRSSYA